MEISKLFNVLVVGGAALVATGCGDDGGDTSAGSGGAGSGGIGGSTTSAQGGAATSAQGGAAAQGGAGGHAAVGGAGGTSGSEGGAAPLECSDEASPTDACGCECCWATGCPNTDESCCGGFCEAGNDGAGCCGL